VLNEPAADYGSFNVGTGIPTTVREVAEALDEHLGFGIEPEVVQQFRAGDIRHCVSDIGRLAALGYRPTKRFADGVAELTEWVRQQTAVDAVDRARAELERRGLTS
jgi:dTDP-L-rhamnose 4-epimerase